uniref:Terminase small subunit n=1 Tax=Weissella thailandensis fsh4-2 TaxID=1056112 RepID=G0UEV7_9LACO|nr:terminase small subunit [Weissella thailandensis fsh4-2]
MKLTEKQKRFADEYINSGNATQAAIKAGYSKKTANRIGPENLSKLVIKNYIDDRMQAIEDSRIMTAKEAVEFLTSVVRGDIKEIVVIGTPVGAEEVEKEADIKTRISAVKELLKRYPDNDKLMEQQLRKLTAEADLSEAKAKEYIEDSSDYDEIQLVFSDRQKKGQDNEN